jgi:hypothetical protein
MNTGEIDRIAAAVNVLRPDWPVKSLRTLLERPELVHRPRRDVAVALTWVACESVTTTPARVLEAGPWWRAAAVESVGIAPRNPRPADACWNCGKTRTSDCCERPSRRPERPGALPPEYLAARGRTTSEGVTHG